MGDFVRERSEPVHKLDGEGIDLFGGFLRGNPPVKLHPEGEVRNIMLRDQDGGADINAR